MERFKHSPPTKYGEAGTAYDLKTDLWLVYTLAHGRIEITLSPVSVMNPRIIDKIKALTPYKADTKEDWEWLNRHLLYFVTEITGEEV